MVRNKYKKCYVLQLMNIGFAYLLICTYFCNRF